MWFYSLRRALPILVCVIPVSVACAETSGSTSDAGPSLTIEQTEEYLKQKLNLLTIQSDQLAAWEDMKGPAQVKVAYSGGGSYFYVSDETPLSFSGAGTERLIHLRYSSVGQFKLERTKARWTAPLIRLQPDPQILTSENTRSIQIALPCIGGAECAKAVRSGHLDYSSSTKRLIFYVGRDPVEAARIAKALRHLLTLEHAKNKAPRDPFD